MNQSLSLLERAIKIAVVAHEGQKDRYGAPYILHPLRVMAGVQTDAQKIVAVLHDLVEDTSWTFEKLRRNGFPKEIVEAIDCLTKRKGESYQDFVSRSASNPLARRVKLADLQDNMDLRRVHQLKTNETERFNKYISAWRRLEVLEKS